MRKPKKAANLLMADSLNTEKEIRDWATKTVLSIRGSYDAPGFEACVNSEIEEIKAIKTELNRLRNE